MVGSGPVPLTFFVEPHCAFADQLRERCGGAVTVAGELRGLGEEEVRFARPSGGFADQAHLTRWMREMMGLTPGAVLPALRPHSRRAT